jgi:hypothetical protein
MNEDGKSDSLVVPTKPPNKAVAAEVAEGRGLAKGNTGSNARSGLRTGRRVSPGLDRVREAAKRDKQARFTALLHHVTVEALRDAYRGLRPRAAAGVDGVMWAAYGENLEGNLQDLHRRLHSGAFRAKPVRRVYIPKADGRQRPLGIASLEDKIAQSAVVEVLNSIYETDFLGFSYGYRPGRSPHQALDALVVGIKTKKVNWVLDADIRDFLETSSHYPPVCSSRSKRLRRVPSGASGSSIRRPLRRPDRRCMARSSPRFTRCNTVCRETPRAFIASHMVTQP